MITKEHDWGEHDWGEREGGAPRSPLTVTRSGSAGRITAAVERGRRPLNNPTSTEWRERAQRANERGRNPHAAVPPTVSDLTRSVG